MEILIYTDGASRGNPGPSASGYEIFAGAKQISHAFFNGAKTNNEAEYIAIIAALKRVGEEFGYANTVSVHSDSELVIRQLSGKYKVKSSQLSTLHSEALSLLCKFAGYKLTNLRREHVRIASVDKALNVLLDQRDKST